MNKTNISLSHTKNTQPKLKVGYGTLDYK